MPSNKPLNVYFLGSGKVIKGGVVTEDRSRAAVACAHPVPIYLKPHAYLRIGIV